MLSKPRDIAPGRYSNEPIPTPPIFPLYNSSRRFPNGQINSPALSYTAMIKGQIFLYPFVAQSNFTTTSFTMFCIIGGVAWANSYVGIYTQNGTLIASSGVLSTPSAQQTIVAPIVADLTQNTSYWIAIQIGSGTTTAGSALAMNYISFFESVPALGTLTAASGIVSSTATFNSTLPSNLATVAFIPTNFAFFVGIVKITCNFNCWKRVQ